MSVASLEQCIINNVFKFWYVSTNKIPGDRINNLNVPVIIDNEDIMDSKVEYIACAPPERRMSFNGSGLPFPSIENAFSVTPNVGVVEGVSKNKEFTIPLIHPNSFYYLSHKVNPTLFLRYKTSNGVPKHRAIQVGNGVPFRTLFVPAVTNHVEEKDTIVTTQEKILLMNAYPITFEGPPR